MGGLDMAGSMKNKKMKKKVFTVVKHVIMILVSAYMLVPLLWGFLTSLKPQNLIFTYPPKFFSGLTLENYRHVFETQNLGQNILSTLGLACISTVIGILFATFAAYIFSRYKFRGKGFFIGFVVCPMLIPGLVNLIPLFTVYTKLGLVDNFFGLILLYLPSVMPFSIMVLQNYLKAIPFTLEEAAMIDGCSRFQLLTKIILPVILPGVIAVAMISFVTIWNEFIITLIFTTGGNLRTLTMGMYYMMSKNNVNYGAVCAVSFVSIVPVLIIFLIFRKQFINSMIDGAIKG